MESYQKAFIAIVVIIFAAAIVALVLGVLSYTHEQDIKNDPNSSAKFESNSFDVVSLTGDVTGTSDENGVIVTTVQTNADLVGPIVFSTGNVTSVPNGVITNAMLASPPLAFIGTTLQQFSVGGSSGTYTLPLAPRKPLYIQVFMVAGGGGGAGSFITGSAASGAGSNGTVTTFGGPSVLSVDPGFGATNDAGGGPGTGYELTIGQGVFLQGGSGSYADSIVFIPNTGGGNTPISNMTLVGGAGGPSGFPTGAGSAPVATGIAGNYGCGGSGGGCTMTITGLSGQNMKSGGGGGAGGFLSVIITNPNNTYAYTVGVGGAGGATGFALGGKGGDGLIQVYEYYQ